MSVECALTEPSCPKKSEPLTNVVHDTLACGSRPLVARDPHSSLAQHDNASHDTLSFFPGCHLALRVEVIWTGHILEHVGFHTPLRDVRRHPVGLLGEPALFAKYRFVHQKPTHVVLLQEGKLRLSTEWTNVTIRLEENPAALAEANPSDLTTADLLQQELCVNGC
ncbi:MAG: hypothetical protein COU34_03750 [Candidatus Magasanikbacteria bacterium CG10_big_fil_rev_8_21_14_0_10_43_9]|nr:MAG: hypothetical protein COU34_03750 [Candidatus Magasanikbacteria bacterium CG10_big_fil_rev_8_21_14_0_10_43_9]